MATEYDFANTTVIEFEDIEKGMFIMHHDTDLDELYGGITHRLDRMRSGWWRGEDDKIVADANKDNYFVPEKKRLLPTKYGSRIRLTEDFEFTNTASYAAGDSFTLNPQTGDWNLDGFKGIPHNHSFFEGAKWEEVFLTTEKP